MILAKSMVIFFSMFENTKRKILVNISLCQTNLFILFEHNLKLKFLF